MSMKRHELAIVVAMLTAVSTFCLEGMKKVGERIEAKEKNKK